MGWFVPGYGSRISATQRKDNDTGDDQNDHKPADTSESAHSRTHPSPSFATAHHLRSPSKKIKHLYYLKHAFPPKITIKTTSTHRHGHFAVLAEIRFLAGQSRLGEFESRTCRARRPIP